MKFPKPVVQLLDYFKTDDNQWRWWAGDPLPEDTVVGPGHSTLWLVPWLFPKASEWHDKNYYKVKEGLLTLDAWNEGWCLLAKEELKETPWPRKLVLQALFPVAKKIMEKFTESVRSGR